MANWGGVADNGGNWNLQAREFVPQAMGAPPGPPPGPVPMNMGGMPNGPMPNFMGSPPWPMPGVWPPPPLPPGKGGHDGWPPGGFGPGMGSPMPFPGPFPMPDGVAAEKSEESKAPEPPGFAVVWSLSASCTEEELRRDLDELDFGADALVKVDGVEGAYGMIFRESFMATQVAIALNKTEGHLKDSGEPLRLACWKASEREWSAEDIPSEIEKAWQQVTTELVQRAGVNDDGAGIEWENPWSNCNY